MPGFTQMTGGKKALALLELTQPRLTLLILFTTLVGFYLGNRGTLPLALLLHTLAGTACIAGGASAFNMYIERRQDALMNRTQARPLPSGRLQAKEVFGFALLLCLLGIAWLLLLVNILTCLLGTLTLLTYLFFYTPLKKKTWLCTLAGALPGALPVMMGGSASSGRLTSGAAVAFLILYLWQLPHFYAIGWIFREDYARAGFPILAVVDSNGSKTSRQVIGFQVLLSLATMMPLLMGAEAVYFIGALLLDTLFLASGFSFRCRMDRASAVRLFVVSLIYLPALFTLLVFGIGH